MSGTEAVVASVVSVASVASVELLLPPEDVLSSGATSSVVPTVSSLIEVLVSSETDDSEPFSGLCGASDVQASRVPKGSIPIQHLRFERTSEHSGPMTILRSICIPRRLLFKLQPRQITI